MVTRTIGKRIILQKILVVLLALTLFTLTVCEMKLPVFPGASAEIPDPAGNC